MDSSSLNLHIENIRAISNANIKLDGITVIAGENGCGKSTISKLTYNVLKTSINFDDIVNEKLRSELRGVQRTLDQITRDISYFLDREEYAKTRLNFRRTLIRSEHQLSLFEGNYQAIDEAIDFLIKVLQRAEDQDGDNKFDKRLERIKRVLEGRRYYYNVRGTAHLNTEASSKDVITLLEDLKEQVRQSGDRAKTLKEERPLSILKEVLNEVFYDVPLTGKYNLVEYGVPLVDRESKKLAPIHSITKTAYVDTPMVLGMDFLSERPHWEDLNELLIQKGSKKSKRNASISDIFINEILNGDVSSIDNDIDESFIFRRQDGKEFDLLEVATGIKSFAILQILYKNGFLDSETLMIVDEPEVHLHPQWVVEYARLIVLLNKHLGVKFLIASHHPDMISAIRQISEKENTEDLLNYYLAEKNENFLYNYRHLGLDIDDIFSSFNIALDRIDLYGPSN